MVATYRRDLWSVSANKNTSGSTWHSWLIHSPMDKPKEQIRSFCGASNPDSSYLYRKPRVAGSRSYFPCYGAYKHLLTVQPFIRRSSSYMEPKLSCQAT